MSNYSDHYYVSSDPYRYARENEAMKAETDRRYKRLLEIKNTYPVPKKDGKVSEPKPVPIPISAPNSMAGSAAYYKKEEIRSDMLERNERIQIASRELRPVDLKTYEDRIYEVQEAAEREKALNRESARREMERLGIDVNRKKKVRG